MGALQVGRGCREGTIEAAGGGPLGGGKRPRASIPISARKYLALQASSAASERVYSVGGLVVTKKRSRLGGERVGGIIFLHESIKHKLW